jgi:hypothetical protein
MYQVLSPYQSTDLCVQEYPRGLRYLMGVLRLHWVSFNVGINPSTNQISTFVKRISQHVLRFFQVLVRVGITHPFYLFFYVQHHK